MLKGDGCLFLFCNDGSEFEDKVCSFPKVLVSALSSGSVSVEQTSRIRSLKS